MVYRFYQIGDRVYRKGREDEVWIVEEVIRNGMLLRIKCVETGEELTCAPWNLKREPQRSKL